jgi:hypothetical protein
MWGALSDERTGLSFIIAAGPRQRILGSESLAAHDHILLSQFRDSVHQEQSGPVIPPGTGFRFCRLLRLAGLRWRHSNPPPHGDTLVRRARGFCQTDVE